MNIKGVYHNLTQNRAAVKARKLNTHTFEVCGDAGVALLPAGTPIIIPTEPIHVVCNGEDVSASGRFAISAETLDPDHMSLDIF